MKYKFRVNGIPQVSLNKVYKGIHWSERKGIKDEWRGAFCGWHFHEKKDGTLDATRPIAFEFPVHIGYIFEQKYPMDSSNLGFMVKLIEDSLVTDQVIQGDELKFVLSTRMIPIKGKNDAVTVFLTDENDLPAYDELLEIHNSMN